MQLDFISFWWELGVKPPLWKSHCAVSFLQNWTFSPREPAGMFLDNLRMPKPAYGCLELFFPKCRKVEAAIVTHKTQFCRNWHQPGEKAKVASTTDWGHMWVLESRISKPSCLLCPRVWDARKLQSPCSLSKFPTEFSTLVVQHAKLHLMYAHRFKILLSLIMAQPYNRLPLTFQARINCHHLDKVASVAN